MATTETTPAHEPPDEVVERARTLFPHPLALLLLCVAVAAVLTFVLPAGRYERRADEATGRTAVVAGSYHAVEATPVGPWGAILSVQKGFISAASIIGFVFLVGGAFCVVEQTGALTGAVDGIVRRFGQRPVPVLLAVSTFFFFGGFVEGMAEECLAFVPILLLLVNRLGYDRVTAVAVSVGAAAVGAGTSPLNPFCVGIAQTIAELPPFSAAGYRVAIALPAFALYAWYTMRHATRTRRAPAADASTLVAETNAEVAVERRSAVVLAIVVAAFGVMILGVVRLGWGIDELAGLFFAMGIVAGLVGGLGTRGTAEGFARGFSGMAYAALVIGFARAILVVLEQGQVIDTIVAGLFAPLAKLPVGLAALGMMAAQSVIHVPVPSWSGQAMLTMPILVPLSDLLGLSRQVTVLAYQYPTGLLDLVVPTNGALVAMLAIYEIPFERWLRFAVGIAALLMAWAALAVLIAVEIGL